tara:strand:- start:592 stop:936 length:345 start_codon:yes stop_codon:yes gene_type:complete
MIEHKTALFIINMLESKLESQRRLLISQQKDSGCPMKIYQNTLDLCEELEYTIQQMEKQMIENTPMDKHIEQMTFSFMNAHDGEQMWFPWAQAEKPIDPKPRKRTKLRKKGNKK